MASINRPVVGTADHSHAVVKFVEQLQRAIDTGSADLFNEFFAADVLWGSPFGAIAEGFDLIHGIHQRMFASVPATPGAAQYAIEKVRELTPSVVVAFIRRLSTVHSDAIGNTAPGSFDELAMIVLVQKDGNWWLAAAQHVPDRRDVYK